MCGDRFALIHAHGFERSGSERHAPVARRIVGGARFRAQRYAVEKKLYLLAVAIDLDLLFVRLARARRPVGEQYLWASVLPVAGVCGRERRRRDAARDVNHRLVAPPTLPLEGYGAGAARGGGQAEVEGDERPGRRIRPGNNSPPDGID